MSLSLILNGFDFVLVFQGLKSILKDAWGFQIQQAAVHSRSPFRTLSNIFDGASLRK